MSAPSWAGIDSNVGTVVAIEGSALKYIKDSKTGIKLVPDSTIALSDTLKTGDKARLLILLKDDTTITLGENASLTIDTFIFDPTAKDGNKADFSILNGAFLFVSGLVGKNDDPQVNIKTSAGSIGLRGTTVWGGEINNKYGVLVQEGSVFVTNKMGRMTLEKGNGVFLSPDTTPEKKAQWKDETIAAAVAMIAFKDQDAANKKLAEKKGPSPDTAKDTAQEDEKPSSDNTVTPEDIPQVEETPEAAEPAEVKSEDVKPEASEPQNTAPAPAEPEEKTEAIEEGPEQENPAANEEVEVDVKDEEDATTDSTEKPETELPQEEKAE
ncbi:MAG: FecR domain-containing protein [Alphaproteobacteria bacterium]|nr:FecR domain-containing protein [Alphaproteobacteria bacterium]MCD8526553.1 FecR domain-containing protein [Alphaproteobacteria bacterium]MCD8571334.1 FecR domain-containing protein [Alphaproteobacteria bacterium]